jgi:hypothetical protein
VLVREYFTEELIGLISRESTAIAGREKPEKRWPKTNDDSQGGRLGKR